MLHDIDEPNDLRWLPDGWRSEHLCSVARTETDSAAH
jgi:hypothetical protein